jgi:class 3 adenylate cyclase
MTPQESFDFVNAYLKQVAPIIRGNNGFVVKFMGDGMMAVFPNGARDGVQAGIAKQLKLREYNAHRQQEGWKPIRVGIGVHMGHIMMGMVGEEVRMQGDVLSDNVNLASRLEGLTKYYGVLIVISGETYKALSNREEYHIRFLDNVAVKGKEQPIKIYEVFDADPEDRFHKKLQILPDFEAAQRLCFDRQFEQALQRFKSVLAVIPDDLTTQLYIERCERYLKEGGVAEGWDGVQKMDQK